MAKDDAKKKPAPPPEPPPKSTQFAEDELYGVIKEDAAEEKVAKKNRVVIGSLQEKFKRSARGPASALLVTPSNLLLGQGALTGIAGIFLIVISAWPLIFTDVSTPDDEFADQWGTILLGMGLLFWAGIVVYGTFQMSHLDSYPWAFVGAVFGLFPLLAGIFALLALKDERVIAGFKEPEGGPNADDPDAAEAKKKKDEDDDEDDDDDDDEDDDDRPKRKKKKKRS